MSLRDSHLDQNALCLTSNDDNAITNANTITNSKTNVNATNVNATDVNTTNANHGHNRSSWFNLHDVCNISVVSVHRVNSDSIEVVAY